MNFLKQPDLGIFFARLGLGIMLLMHGIAKILNGIGFIKNLALKQGLPEFITYGVYVGEVIAPVLLILGIYTRVASAIVLATCAAILYLFYLPNGDLFALSSNGGFKPEIVYLYISLGFCILLNGSGKYALKRD
ncbi:DoxX family protein [Campylobacter sp. 9BO]|uniref:DoxX family protein n=1 Tax=Campylobacter sp. 9BO TaxID=3424759 RepID=UPI003D34C869